MRGMGALVGSGKGVGVGASLVDPKALEGNVELQRALDLRRECSFDAVVVVVATFVLA